MWTNYVISQNMVASNHRLERKTLELLSIEPSGQWKWSMKMLLWSRHSQLRQTPHLIAMRPTNKRAFQNCDSYCTARNVDRNFNLMVEVKTNKLKSANIIYLAISKCLDCGLQCHFSHLTLGEGGVHQIASWSYHSTHNSSSSLKKKQTTSWCSSWNVANNVVFFHSSYGIWIGGIQTLSQAY